MKDDLAYSLSNSILFFLDHLIPSDSRKSGLVEPSQTRRLVMTTDTTASSYWLNWRFLLCAIWVLVAIVISSLLIWRYEGGRKKSRSQASEEQDEGAGCLYEDDSWGTCLVSVHPIWLMAFRIFAFCAMLALLLADSITHGGGIFTFYTQWTFTLVSFYFLLGSILSVRGCLCGQREVDVERDDYVGGDSEKGIYAAPALRDNPDTPSPTRSLNYPDRNNFRAPASFWTYSLQIILQISAGAVALTDSVFWLIIYPFQTGKDYRLTFVIICMHSVNAVFLLGDTSLNRLRFPFFRIAYFVLWTCAYVIFQWIVHACVSIQWPYTFFDLSSQYAPLWYLGVGLMLFPCFGIFALVFRIKRCYTVNSRHS